MADQQPDAADPSPLISLAEAARRTGRHPEALRALVRRGRPTARRGNDGRLLLRLDDLPADLPEPAATGQWPGERPDLAWQLADLETLVGELRDELLGAKLGIGRLEAERDTASALGEARVATVRAEVAAKEELIAELRAMLADARRPWWRRLMGA